MNSFSKCDISKIWNFVLIDWRLIIMKQTIYKSHFTPSYVCEVPDFSAGLASKKLGPQNVLQSAITIVFHQETFSLLTATNERFKL